MVAPRRLAVLMFTDMIGTTALEQENEAVAITAPSLLDRRFVETVTHHSGGRSLRTVREEVLDR